MLRDVAQPQRVGRGCHEVALDEVLVGRDVDQILMPLLRAGQANEALFVHDSSNQLLVHDESAFEPQGSLDAANAVWWTETRRAVRSPCHLAASVARRGPMDGEFVGESTWNG